MEEKPQKKEQLLLANNVLKLSSDLLKELDKRSHDILGIVHTQSTCILSTLPVSVRYLLQYNEWAKRTM